MSLLTARVCLQQAFTDILNPRRSCGGGSMALLPPAFGLMMRCVSHVTFTSHVTCHIIISHMSTHVLDVSLPRSRIHPSMPGGGCLLLLPPPPPPPPPPPLPPPPLYVCELLAAAAAAAVTLLLLLPPPPLPHRRCSFHSLLLLLLLLLVFIV